MSAEEQNIMDLVADELMQEYMETKASIDLEMENKYCSVVAENTKACIELELEKGRLVVELEMEKGRLMREKNMMEVRRIWEETNEAEKEYFSFCWPCRRDIN